MNASTGSQAIKESPFKRLMRQRVEEKFKKIQTKPEVIDDLADTFPKQLAFIKDKARFKLAVCSRRAGKTNGIGRELVEVAGSGWEHNALYIAKNSSACKRIMWTMLLQILYKRFPKSDYKTNASELSIYFRNTNSFIWLVGANDSAQVEKLRGVKLAYCCIDEAQSFPSYIAYLVDEIIAPSLTDLQGRLVLAGTPNPMASGYLYDMCQMSSWSKHHWTIEDNPFYLASAMKANPEITCILDIITAEAKRRGVPLSDPAIQRDYYGLWVKSTELQVYKYNSDINDYGLLPAEPMTVVLGIDLGFSDSDAICAVGFVKGRRMCYLLEEYKESKNDITALTKQIMRFIETYKPYCCVIDTGGLGKKIAAEISNRKNLSLIAAERERKPEFVELLNDDLRNGKVKIKKESKTAGEMNILCWDAEHFEKGKFLEDPGLENHCADAFLYAWRYAYHYIYHDLVERELTYEEKDELRLIAKLERDKQIREGVLWE